MRDQTITLKEVTEESSDLQEKYLSLWEKANKKNIKMKKGLIDLKREIEGEELSSSCSSSTDV